MELALGTCVSLAAWVAPPDPQAVGAHHKGIHPPLLVHLERAVHLLYSGEQMAANPMPLVGRPKLPNSLPKALPPTAIHALLGTVASDHDSKRQTDWPERDLALILTPLLAGLRADSIFRDQQTGGDRVGRLWS